MRERFGFSLGSIVLAGLVPARWAGAQVSFPPPLELRVPKPPTVASGLDGSFLAFELHITNFSQQAMTVRRVEVVNAGSQQQPGVLLTLADSSLTRAISRPGLNLPAAERSRLGGGTRAVVFLWAPVERNQAPPGVRTRVTVELGSGDSVRTQELEGPPVSVMPEGAAIAPPLRGGPWLTGNGPAPQTGHRRALVPIGGTPSIAQRFAIDFVKVDSSFRTFSGDSLKNESYYAYGSEVVAVASGKVVATKDSIPQNVPGVNSRAVPITLETVGGNHVVLDLGEGRYAFYAHLQPGSLRVRVGDRVKAGQVIGLVGNSGNSTEPHLHFHVADGISPLGSEGIPYRLTAYELVGRCRAFNTGCEVTSGAPRRSEVPLGNLLIRFP